MKAGGAAVPIIPVEMLLAAYSKGIFPMADAQGSIEWHRPDPRAIFDLENVIVDRATARLLRNGQLRFTVNQAFEAVMRRCAQRRETWIDERMVLSYAAMHAAGSAHSVEAWSGDELVGGIYGVALGAAFFGESMFGTNNAGKAAFHMLVDRLCERGFMLFDTQYINPFTATLGAYEVPRALFEQQLGRALAQHATFA